MCHFGSSINIPWITDHQHRIHHHHLHIKNVTHCYTFTHCLSNAKLVISYSEGLIKDNSSKMAKSIVTGVALFSHTLEVVSCFSRSSITNLITRLTRYPTLTTRGINQVQDNTKNTLTQRENRTKHEITHLQYTSSYSRIHEHIGLPNCCTPNAKMSISKPRRVCIIYTCRAVAFVTPLPPLFSVRDNQNNNGKHFPFAPQMCQSSFPCPRIAFMRNWFVWFFRFLFVVFSRSRLEMSSFRRAWRESIMYQTHVDESAHTCNEGEFPQLRLRIDVAVWSALFLPKEL